MVMIVEAFANSGARLSDLLGAYRQAKVKEKSYPRRVRSLEIPIVAG